MVLAAGPGQLRPALVGAARMHNPDAVAARGQVQRVAVAAGLDFFAAGKHGGIVEPFNTQVSAHKAVALKLKQIGRASCRERVESSGGAASIEKKSVHMRDAS